MPTDDPKGEPTPGPFVGFQTYADDTPRAFEAPQARDPERRSREVPPAIDLASSQSYGAARPVPVWPKLALRVAVLAAFGGGFLLARTEPGPATAKRPVSEAAAMAAAQPMNVEVAAATPLPPPPAADATKLEVLPSTPRSGGLFTPLPPAPRETPTPAVAPPPPAAPAPREVAQAPAPRDAVAVAPPPERASFDCRDAPTRAREMVCRDAALAAMDRRMKQAYAAAMAAGAPREDLAADQEDWLEVREEAATYSRRAVADIYRQRIDELYAMAGRR